MTPCDFKNQTKHMITPYIERFVRSIDQIVISKFRFFAFGKRISKQIHKNQ